MESAIAVMFVASTVTAIAMAIHQTGSKSMTGIKRWAGELPTKCNICQGAIDGRGFIDGKTVHGPWAIMHVSCHSIYGVGLGTGRGQKYNADGVKVEG